MVAALRAGVSVVMLAGFYVLALAQLGAAGALAIWLASVLPGALALKLTFPLFTATVGAVAVAMWRAIRTKPEPPHGLPITPQEAPALWGTVRELAREVDTRMPDEIRLVPEVNAAVMEESRLMGLIGGRRYLYIGLPLLQVLSVSQIRSVLAHELGHYSGRHTRFGGVAYRGHLAIAGTVERISPYNVAGWIFKAYANLYVLVDHAVMRRQEYEADQASVRVAGRTAAASALREKPVLDAAWGFYFRNYVLPGWEAGYVPDDLFGGFAALVAARQAELEALRAEEPEEESSKWDTHPPVQERIAAILAAPEAPLPYDGRPAAGLLPDILGAGRRMQELMVDVGERTVLPWPHFTNAMITAQLQRQADRVFRTIARRFPQAAATQINLGTVFNLIAAGHLGYLAEPFFPDNTRREAGQRFAEVLELLMRLAAVRSGVAGWQHSWSGPAQFVTAHGYPLPLDEIAKLAVAPGGLDEAYRRLVDLGIDITKASLVERTESAVGAGLIAALANVKANGTEFDLLVLTKGLIFVSNPGDANKGKQRLQGLIQSAPVAELARQHWFLPYEEIASAAITRQVPARATLTLHGGQTIELQERWESELLAKDSRDVLLKVLHSMAADEDPAMATPRPAPVPAAAPVSAAAPATAAAPPVGGPPARPRRSLLTWFSNLSWKGKLRVGLIAVAVVGAPIAIYLGMDEPTRAKVGDCMSGRTESDLRIVECTDAAAEWTVVARLEGKTAADHDDEACAAYPNAAASFYVDGGRRSKGFVLCLAAKE